MDNIKLVIYDYKSWSISFISLPYTHILPLLFPAIIYGSSGCEAKHVIGSSTTWSTTSFNLRVVSTLVVVLVPGTKLVLKYTLGLPLVTSGPQYGSSKISCKPYT